MTAPTTLHESELKALTLQARKAEEETLNRCALQGIAYANMFAEPGARARWDHGYNQKDWSSIPAELGGAVGSEQWFEFARGQQARQIQNEYWMKLANSFGGAPFGDPFAAMLDEHSAEEPTSDSPRP